MICGADDEARYDLARKTIRKAPEIQAFRRVRIPTVTLKKGCYKYELKRTNNDDMFVYVYFRT